MFAEKLEKVEKNKTYRVEISDLTEDGQGIGKIDGFVVFVEGAIPGDLVEAKIIKVNKSRCYGKLEKIIAPSQSRVVPSCKYSKKCGGCPLMSMEYGAQTEHKRNTIINCLERIGKIAKADKITKETITMQNEKEGPYHYRNKAQFPVKKNALHKGADIGFFSKRSHDVIDIHSCAVAHKSTDKILAVFKKFLNDSQKKILPYDETSHTGHIRHIFTRAGFASGELMVCIVINGDALPNGPELGKLTSELSAIENMASIMLNINKDKTNVILGDKNKLLWGKDHIIDYIGDKKFKISANSFYQVNPAQTKKLYDTVLKYAGEGEECIDAYCGIGTISILLSPRFKKIYGIEVVPQATENASENAKLNCITNTEFLTGKSEEIIPELTAGREPFDLIVVDPPRKGCDPKLISCIAESKAKKLIYVSCDPATLARDIKSLTDGGAYELEEVTPVDMFPHTMHIEAVALLCLRRE